jgi:D-alanyl-D-alanine carboxypeptidase
MKATFKALPKDIALEMRSTGVWQEASPVPLERLSFITIPYIDFEGNSHNDGELIALDVFAEHITEVFSELYKMGFPINKIRGTHHYGGDDELSMADNNTSCFCYRPIAGSALISVHAYGVAIDINPLQNPFVVFDEDEGTAKVHPQKGWEFINRHNKKAGMIEEIVPLLTEHGFFIWGGRWTTPIDYHHFQPQRGIAELLTMLNFDDGKRFIDSTIKYRERLPTLASMPYGDKLQPLIDLYKKNKSDFFDRWIDHIA